MSEARLSIPNVEVEIDGIDGDLHPLVVRIEQNTNALLSIKIGYDSNTGGEDQAQQVLASRDASTMAELQRRAFAGKEDADARVDIEIDGTSLSLRAFVAGPSYMLSRGQLVRAAELKPRISLLSAFKPFIYDYSGSSFAEESESGLLSGASWAERFGNAYEFMKKEGVGRFSAYPDDELELVLQQHATNQKLEDLWNEFLNASVSSTRQPGLQELNEASLAQAMGLNQTVLQLLAQESNDFLGTMLGLGSMFQLVYVPDVDPEKTGRFILRRRLSDGSNAIDRPVDGISITINSLIANPLPLQQVLMRGRGDHIWGEVGTMEELRSLLPMIYAYPEDSVEASGNVMPAVLPPFLTPLEYNEKLEAAGTAATDVREAALQEQLDIETYSADSNNLVRRIRRPAEKVVEKMIREYSRNLYADNCLAGYGLSFTVPLDLSWRAGERYRLTTGGAPLCEGFAATAIHNLAVRPDSGTATTTIVMTHVTFGDFKPAAI